MVLHSAVGQLQGRHPKGAPVLEDKNLMVTSRLLFFSFPAPKIVFNRLNGKKYHHPAPALTADKQQQQEESFTAAHEQNVKFVHEGEGKGGKLCQLC